MLLGLAVLAALTACGHHDVLPGGRPVATSGPTTVPFDLYTHCGIHELTYDGRWYERREGILDDGSGNPPPGWDNPFQAGVLTVEGASAVFTDDAGHHESFAVRTGATGFKTICA